MKLPWNPNLRENQEEFAEWQRIWQSVPHREIADISQIDGVRYFGYDFGELVSATISAAPEQYIEGLYFPINECPLCSLTTTRRDSLAASLNAEFIKITRLGVFVRVHTKCFDQLTLLDAPPPIPA